MPYYAYIAHHEGYDAKEPWRRRRPITCIEFVKGRKDGKARLERLLKKHPFLPQTGWKERIMHSCVATEDNKVIEQLKNRIRRKCSTAALGSYDERRLWADQPGAPAGFYRLDFTDANRILRNELDASGLYRAGG